MAEEEDPNKHKKYNEHKEVVTSIGNSWIICRSQSHGGRIYYFNTLTGKAVWNLSDAEITKAQLHTMAIVGQAGASIRDCPEPMEPPGDSPDCSQMHLDTSKQTRIYNKQIINNQFTKPYAVSPFVTPPCHCSSLNRVKVVPTPLYNPAIWTVPPTHQVYLAPTVTPLANQVQPLCDHDIPTQIRPVPLSSRFQIINQLVNNKPSPPQGIHKNHQRFQNLKPWRKQSFLTRKVQNTSNNDLRDVISSKRRDLVKEEVVEESWNSYNEQGNTPTEAACEEANITEEELYPSDIDEEWLKANTLDESNTIDTSPIWRLGGGDADPNFWFIVPTTGVLLNHLNFLSRLFNSDARLRLVAPAAALRRLRARTAGAARRLPQRARAAIRFATMQMYKIPADLKSLQDGSIASCCLGLIRLNYHVIILMTDEEESHNRDVYDNIPIFTVNDLKQCLAQNPRAPDTKSHENILITILSNDVNTSPNLEDTHKDTEPTEPMPEDSSFEINEQCTDDTNLAENKAVEIQTDLVTSPIKKTVSTSVQTDFEYYPTPSNGSANSSSLVYTTEIDRTLPSNTVIESSNDSKEIPKVTHRKIKLNRKQATLKSEPAQKTTPKWRKRRAEPPKTNVNPKVDEVKQTVSDKSSSMDIRNDLLLQQNDNAVDYEKNTETSELVARIDEKVSNKESTVSVISNSIDSDSMFKINQKAILSQSVIDEDIQMFEVTSDVMGEYLVMRRDEWVSRFVQIMEEALTQVLQSEPYLEPAIPPPWSVHEASLCVKRKFENNSKVASASDKLIIVLHQISDSKGKINADLNPTDFMRMYSCGVNLIKNLQDVLKDSEDLLIASNSLSKLLIDIRDPNLDVSNDTFIDTFNDDKLEETSNTETGMIVSEDTILAGDETPQMVPQQQTTSNKSSPCKRNLRSSVEQRKEAAANTTRTVDDDYSFFTCLRLQRTNSSESAIKDLNSRDQSSPPKPDDVPQLEPRIIRNFNVCADFEEKLKKNRFQETDDKYFAEDNAYTESELYLDFAPPEEPCGGDDADARTVLKWFMDRTTYSIHRVLLEIHRFCTDTHEKLKTKKTMEQTYMTKLSEKTAQVTIHMNNLCKYLNRILHRQDTRTRFRYMLRELGVADAPMTEEQEAEYRAVVQKYLDQANVLLEAVQLAGAAAQGRQRSAETSARTCLYEI